MIIRKKNSETFYRELRFLLPEIEKLEVWKSFDREGIGINGSQILNDIAEQTIEWTKNNKVNLMKKLLDFFELSYDEFDDDAIAYIYTDFLPTMVITNNTVIRERIKKSMGAITKKHYNQLIELGFYSEVK